MLSDLIREGAAKRPQAWGVAYTKEPEKLSRPEDASRQKRVGATCALGAAADAAGFPVRSIANFDSNVPPGWLSAMGAARLFCITVRNDGGMTREEIADWIAEKPHRDVAVPVLS